MRAVYLGAGIVATSVVAALGFAAPARADEPAKEPVPGVAPLPVDEATAKVVALEATVAQHKKDQDDGALGKDLEDIADAHKATTDPRLRDRLNALLGAILKGTRNDTLEKAALKTIGDLGDPANWKYVREYVQQPDPKVAPNLINEGIECAGKLKADGAVDPLLKIVDKSKVFPVAASALKALGNFGASRRHRTRIVEEVIGTVRKTMPGRGGLDPESGTPAPKSGGDAGRWGVLSPALVEACNKLTGQNASSAQDWFDLYDRYKKDLNALFPK